MKRAFLLAATVLTALPPGIASAVTVESDRAYQGYFEGKNYLGECAAVAFLLSLHEIVCRGWRRVFGIIIVALAFLLVYLSNSKTALDLALVCPFLAALTLMVRRLTGVSVRT
jgi:exopolysaccharide production protein ExoQ